MLLYFILILGTSQIRLSVKISIEQVKDQLRSNLCQIKLYCFKDKQEQISYGISLKMNRNELRILLSY